MTERPGKDKGRHAGIAVRRIDERWEETMEAVAERAARAALADNRFAAGGSDFTGFEIVIALADDALLRALNARHRGRDATTDVLSFPAVEAPTAEWLAIAGRSGEGEPAPLGDVVVAYETAVRDAREIGRPISHHLAHLVVHGVLHCLGYDHMEDDEAEEMESLERRILARLGIPDPGVTTDVPSGDDAIGRETAG